MDTSKFLIGIWTFGDGTVWQQDRIGYHYADLMDLSDCPYVPLALLVRHMAPTALVN